MPGEWYATGGDEDRYDGRTEHLADALTSLNGGAETFGRVFTEPTTEELELDGPRGVRPQPAGGHLLIMDKLWRALSVAEFTGDRIDEIVKLNCALGWRKSSAPIEAISPRAP